MRTCNPEIEQDRVADAFELFNKSGVMMFHQQVRIYELLTELVEGHPVLEAGCGIGMGTAMLSQKASSIVGTDKLRRNVAFAQCLYPWIPFQQWDINQPFDVVCQVVVAVEVFEHAENPIHAMRNLLASTGDVLCLSTPNGNGKTRPPSNPFHVQEYTTEEMLSFIRPFARTSVTIHHWQTWELLEPDTRVDPLIYRIRRIRL